MRFKTLFCSLMMLGVLAPMASAGTMDLFMTPARFDLTTFDPLPITFDSDGRISDGQAGYYVMTMSFQAAKTNDAVEKGWLNTLYSVTTAGDPGLQTVSGTYTPVTATTDINGGAPGGVNPVYGTNQDGGTPGDLLSIITSMVNSSLPENHPTDRRNDVGTPLAPASVGYPSVMGTFDVTWDGTGISELIIPPQQFAFSLDVNQAGPTQVGTGASQGFGSLGPTDVPPGLVDKDILGVTNGDLVMAQLSDLPPAGMQATGDPATWSLGAFTYIPAYGGLTPNNQGDAGLDGDGTFSWQTGSNQHRGIYQWDIGASNPGGSDNAFLRVHVQFVPEPSTFALFGLAMVGLVGVYRRR